MPQQKHTIYKDAFLKDAAQLPWLKGKSFEDVISYYNENHPGSLDEYEFLDRPEGIAEPGEIDKFLSGFRELDARKKAHVHNLAGTGKELARTSESDFQSASDYQQKKGRWDPNRRAGSPRGGHVGRDTREMADLMSQDELREYYDASISQADIGREADAKRHEELVKESDEIIANDPKIQAVRQWYEENPVDGYLDWWSADNISYGIGQFASSFVPIVAAGVAGSIVGGPAGGFIAAGSAGYALEAGNHFDTAYKVAKEELGMDDASAYEAASNTSHMYGLVSAFLESLAPGLALKTMALPRTLTPKFARMMMNSTNKRLAKMGKNLDNKMAAQLSRQAQAESYEGFAKATREFMQNGSIRAAVYNMYKKVPGFITDRGPVKFQGGFGLSESWQQAALEGFTEGTQYLAEEMILDGYLRPEELPDGWLAKKLKSDEFRDSVMLGSFALFGPGGGGMRRSGRGYDEMQGDEQMHGVVPSVSGTFFVYKNDKNIGEYKTEKEAFDAFESIDDKKVADDGTVISGEGLDPRKDGTWIPEKKEVKGKEVDVEDEPVKQSGFMGRLKAFVGPLNKQPQRKMDGEEITDLGATVLEEILGQGWNGILELENHLLGDGERSHLLQLVGGAIKKADKNNIFNIREDKEGIINEDDVKWTLRGIMANDMTLSEQDSPTTLGAQRESDQTIDFKPNMKHQERRRRQFEDPTKLGRNFGALQIPKLAEQQAVDRAAVESTANKPPPKSVEGQQARGQLAKQQDKGIELLHDQIQGRYIDQYQSGDTQEVRKEILGLKAGDFREFVANQNYDIVDNLDLNDDGSVKSNKRNKELVWDMFNQEMDADLTEAAEIDLSRGQENVYEEQNETPLTDNVQESLFDDENEENVTPTNNTKPPDIMDDDGKEYDFSQVELKEGEEVQPKAYQKVGDTFEPTQETVEITERLSKHFPDVEASPMQKVFDENGVEVAGKAFKNIAEWSQDKARIDDMPHEYFHIYLDTFANSPIIKAGLKKFTEGAATVREAKEQFTELVGNYYANRIKDKGLRARLKSWIRQAWLHFKKKFGKLSKQEYAEIVGEQFFQGARPTTQAMGVKTVYYSKVDVEETTPEDQQDDDGKQQEIATADNLKGNTRNLLENIFFPAFGANIPKTYIAKDVPELANSIDSYEDFEPILLKDILEKFGGQIDNMAKFKETLKTLYLQHRSRTLIAKVQENEQVIDEDGVKQPRKIINIDPANGRIRLEMIFNKGVGRARAAFSSFKTQFLTNHVRKGVKNPQSFVQNFMELQDKILGDGARFIYLPQKLIFKHVKRKEGDPFWVNDSRDLKLNASWVNTIDTDFASSFKAGKQKFLAFFFTTKDGDNKQMILGVVPTKWVGSQQVAMQDKEINVTKVKKKFFEAELKAQVNAKLMTQKQADQMSEDAERLSKVRLKTKDEKSKKWHYMGNLAYANVLSHHIRWQQVKGSDYMWRHKDIVDIVNRVRIDFAEGVTPYGSGERKILWMNAEGLEIKSPNKDGDMESWDRRRPFGSQFDGEDGVLYTGGQYLQKLAGVFGIKDMADVKTSIRHIENSAENKHTYPHYIGMKHMEMTPMPGMQIFKKGESEPFFEVVGQGKNTRFRILKGEQAGMEFDSFGTNNEVKDSSGKFKKEGVVHVLPETATKVLIKSKSARTASHPVNVHELMLSDELNNEDFAEGKEYVAALQEYIEQNVNDRMDKIIEFRNNPAKLRDFLYRELRTGEMPSELQQYVNLTKNGDALTLPSVLSQVISMLNNQFITGGMMRMRTEDGRGTKLTLKPKGALNINPRSAIVSAQNTTIVNLVEREYAKSLGYKEDFKFQGFKDEHDRIKTLNEFLKSNPFTVMLHRQPIQGATKYEPRVVQSLLEGNHGNTVFLSSEDVFVLHDGDFDGDVVYLEKPENERLAKAMDALSQSEWFNARKKVVGLEMFLKKLTGLSLSSRADRGLFYQSNANAMFSEGMTVNAKTIANTMAYKNFTFADNTLPRNVHYEVRKPDEIVTMDYISLDAEALMNKEIWDLIHETNGDKVVVANPDFNPQDPKSAKYFEVKGSDLPNILKEKEPRTLHLQTTFENEMSNILQMAVDNKKFGLLSDINFGSPFLMKRIFKRSDGAPLSKKQIYPIKQVYQTFAYSRTRRGKNKFNNSLEMSEMFIEFNDLYDRYYDKDGDFHDNQDIAENIELEVMSRFKKPYKIKINKSESIEWQILDVNMDGKKITPLERLIIQPEKYLNTKITTDERNQQAATPLHHQENHYNYAHVYTMKDFQKALQRRVDAMIETNDMQTIMQGYKALEFAEEMADEFYGILSKIAEQKNVAVSEIEGIRYDLSEDFVEFTEKWMEKYSELNDTQQMMATVKFLSGSKHINEKGRKTKKAFVKKLLPIDLMHKKILKSYVKRFKTRLNDKDKGIDVTEADARYGFGWNRFQEILKENKCI